MFNARQIVTKELYKGVVNMFSQCGGEDSFLGVSRKLEIK